MNHNTTDCSKQINRPSGTLRLKLERPTSAAERSERNAEQRRISSVSLFGEEREIRIHHCGNDYRLRITRQDKLILTK